MKNKSKIQQKWMQDLRRKIKIKKIASNGFGMDLSSIWEGCGTVWDVSWALLGAFWSFHGRSKSNFLKALVQDGPQEASGIDLGLILKDLGRVLGGFGKSLRKVWARIKQFRNNVSSMQGGGRCLREAVSIRK